MIKNEIHHVSFDEAIKIKQAVKKDESIWLVEINGKDIQSWQDYSTEIEKDFKFPTSCTNSMDRYLDWIRDLTWLNTQGFVLIINHFNEFLKNDLKTKFIILEDLEKEVLPWWQTEVEKFVMGGIAKPFNVYLVD